MTTETGKQHSKNKERSPERELDLGTRLVDRIRQAVNEQWQEIDSADRVDAFTSLYLRPRDRCVPEWFLGDEILDDIMDLYHYPLAAVRDELAERQGVLS